MSNIRSNFKIVITLLIFKIECRSKAQIVGHWTRYLVSMHNLRYYEKGRLDLKTSLIFLNFVILNIALIRYQKWKDHVRITQDKCILEWKRR